jgi:RNA polymerase sigma-70 factor (ECF subfamily)
MQTSAKRTNEEWLASLRSSGAEYEAAVEDLLSALRRAALFYLRRHRAELSELADDEIDALAEDAGQEACVSVLNKLDQFRGEAHLLTWASKFAVGNALVAFRRRQWRDLSLDRVPDGWQQPADTLISRDGWAHPEFAAKRNEVWQVLQQAADQDLTEKQRQVFNYILIQGISAEVVGGRLGMTANAVYKLTHDARRKFKSALERRGYSKGDILEAFAGPGE